MKRKEEETEVKIEKMLDWLYSRELTWAVLILTCFMGLIELLPEIKCYGQSINGISLTGLLIIIAIGLIGGCVFSVDRFVRLTDVEGNLERRLPKTMRSELYSTMGPVHRLLYKIDKDGNYLGWKRWVRPVAISVFVAIWTAIIVLKIIS